MSRKPPIGISLAEVNSELAKEWHPSKNGELTPFDVTTGSNKKIWWQCPVGKDHEWLSSVNSRANGGSGCPICANRMVVKSNCMATTHPELSAQWHPTKNEGINTKEVSATSHKKVWWKCPKGDDHEWKTALVNRANGQGCPVCSNNKIVRSNSLGVLNPELAKEWHSTKNGKLTPFDVGEGSGKKVWWKCAEGDDHQWLASLSKRSNGRGCPVCVGQKVVYSNSLANTHPDLLEEWHPTKNKSINPEEITAGSSKKSIWWICQKNEAHIWKAFPSERNRGRGCPYCTGRRVDVTNNLAENYPDVAMEWHPTKNGDLLPSQVVSGSGKNVWWQCPVGEDHEWKTTIDNRVRKGVGCPICSNYIIIESNSLGTKNPELAKEWHPTKNGDLTPFQVGEGSEKKVWWKCPKGEDHEWPATLTNRKKGKGCPYCTLTPQSRQELIITFELLTIFKGINPKGFKTRVNGKLWSIDTFIPSLNVGIEFDGAYWHKDKAQLDKVKTERIEDTGLNLIRVRQKPLERLFEDDVMAEKKFDGKQITNDILKQIVKDDGKYAYKLNKRTLDKIDKYLKLGGLQNEKVIDKYIDQILTEKAERKK